MSAGRHKTLAAKGKPIMQPIRRFEIPGLSAPAASQSALPQGFIICPMILSPSALLAWQHASLYQAAYLQAKAVHEPPRHNRLFSCLN